MDFDILVPILVPIFLCVVLPVSIVYIVFRAAMNNDNKRAEVLIKAIEANNGIDADRLADALAKPKKTAREILNLRLLRGSIFSLIGLLFAGVGVFNYCNDSHPDSVTVPFLCGAISLAIGIGYLIVFFFSRKHVEDEVVAEDIEA